ncbi:MAG TPA: DUF4184 family protein [Steroidobacteraceae bacterium]
MPFTISHAAAVLPLRKLRLPLAAMMIGSMSPDFAYFVPGQTERVETHSIPGVFWFCWPVSLALWLLFVRVLEQPTTALLPESWRSRFPPSNRELTFATWAAASAAVVIGAMTHLLWDSFTHRGTGAVQLIPALASVAFHFDGWRIRWFVVLQHLSTIFGFLILMIWAWRQPSGRYPRPAAPTFSNATRIRCAAIIVATSLGLAITGYVLNSDVWFTRRLFHFAIGGMTGFAVAWLAIALITAPRLRA